MSCEPDASPPPTGVGFRRRAAVSVLVAIGLALVIVVATAEGPDAVSGGLGGDYPSFYAAGEILLDDPGLDPERFYDPGTQFEAQEPVLPPDSEGNLYFAYPAFFVAPFVALAAFGFEVSYFLNVVLMLAAVWLALHLLRPCSRIVRERPVETLAVALTFYPLFRGVTGGQNTALSLLAFAVVWRSLDDGRELPAGIAAGLLLFKPPLALPILGGLLLSRRYKAVTASVVTAVALYAVGALLTGPSWPAVWLDAVRYLDEVDTPFNVQNFVSLPGVAEAVFGVDSTAAAVVGFGLAAIVVVVVSLVWLRGERDVDVLISITVSGSLLISPHALYYDAGLLVLVGVVIADRRPDLRRWLVLLWAAGFTHLLADPLGVDPLVVLVLAAFGLSLTVDRTELRVSSSSDF